jgi:plastocyanin
MPMTPGARVVALICGCIAVAGSWVFAAGEGVPVTGTVLVSRHTRGPVDNGNVVVWLKAVGDAGGRPEEPASPRARPRVIQQHKHFEPHLLVVPVGSVVEFPNLDPFFHNVFSLFEGKRFDLGLYEAGTTRSVAFNKVGVSYIFCNIHPEMSALVVAIDTPHYAVSSRAGEFTVPNVPPGRYVVSVWHERHKLQHPEEFPRQVTISPSTSSLGSIRFIEPDQMVVPHQNKYGHEYSPPPPSSPIYKH